MVGRVGCRDGRGGCGDARQPWWGRRGERLLAWVPVPFLATRHAVRCIANLGALHARPRSSSAADVRCVPGFGSLLLAPSHRGLVRIRSASAVGALGPHHLGGVLLVENLVAVAAFKCLLDHGGLLFRRGMRFGRAAVRASCPLHGKARPVFLENAKCLVDECWTLRLPESLLSENAARGPYCGHVARAEWGNSALGIFVTCGFTVVVPGCSSWGAEKEAPLQRFLTIQHDFSAVRPHRGVF